MQRLTAHAGARRPTRWRSAERRRAGQKNQHRYNEASVINPDLLEALVGRSTRSWVTPQVGQHGILRDTVTRYGWLSSSRSALSMNAASSGDPNPG